MKQTIGYTRISSNSLEQLHALEQHKARLKAAGCNKIYYDDVGTSHVTGRKARCVSGAGESGHNSGWSGSECEFEGLGG
jgi:hypothetical protein